MSVGQQDWIGNLPPPLREQVLACMPARRFVDGELIYRAGDKGEELYRVERGNVRIFSLTDGGRELLYGLFSPGSCFGEASLIDGEARPHTTQAIGDVVLRVLARERFEWLWNAHPEVSWAVARLQIARARRLYGFYEQVSLDALSQRIAHRLCSLAKTLGHPRDDGVYFDMRLTQEDIGLLVAGSRQSVNKVLRQWRRDGLIELAYGSLTIRDLPSLEQLALAGDRGDA